MKTDFKSDASTSWPFVLPDDGWHQLTPRGRFEGIDELTGEKVVQVIDQVAIDSILHEFKRVAAAENFAGLLIDYDHFSEDIEKSSVAAGWMIEMQERADGIWFRARWSAEGESNLKAGCYRQISPSMEGVYIGENEVRPMIINRAGLTNDPKFKNMRPLSNRGGGDKPHNSHRTKETQSMKSLLALLGLSADASEESAASALTTLINRDKAAKAELATMKNRVETAEGDLATAKTATLSAEADAFCETHKAKIKNRDVIHAQYVKDPEGTKALVEGLEVGKVSLKNRSKRQPGKEDTQAEATNARQLETKVQEYKGQNRCSYQTAHEAICRAHPELLKEESAQED